MAKRKIQQKEKKDLPEHLYKFLTTGVEPEKDDPDVWQVAFLSHKELCHLWDLHKDSIKRTWKSKKRPWAMVQCESK